MKQFSDLGIETQLRNFEGDKISPDSVIGKNIQVIGFRVVESKFQEKGTGKCLHLQIEFNGERRVMFSGSGYLIDTIQKVDKSDFPFATVIIKQNKRFEFT